MRIRFPIPARIRRSALCLFAALSACALLLGCPEARVPKPTRPPKAEKWFRRAEQEFQAARIDAARDSVRQALDLVPADEPIRLLAARVALARLEYAEVVRLLNGIESTAASALRGRAFWYDGDLESAADQLEVMLADPEVVDPWAKAIVKLARRGVGRSPFTIDGGLLAVVDMPVIGVPAYVVPLEIDGDQALALVSTGNPEVVLDSATRREPSWVSLRFGKQLEVRDVPAVVEDLSGISNQLRAPIKALLGSNLLRHLNVTLDLRGRQFVVRSFVPPPPPVASRVDLYYLRGGGMVMGSRLGGADGPEAALFVDTSMTYPVSLDRAGWLKLGIDAETLPRAEAGAKLRNGSIPVIRLGAFDVPQVPAVYGAPLEKLEKKLNIDVDGVVGAGLLSHFRLTLSDGGRLLWVEQQPEPPPAGTLAPTNGLPPVPPVVPPLTDPAAGVDLPPSGID